jgi:hypothetical protein
MKNIDLFNIVIVAVEITFYLIFLISYFISTSKNAAKNKKGVIDFYSGVICLSIPFFIPSTPLGLKIVMWLFALQGFYDAINDKYFLTGKITEK